MNGTRPWMLLRAAIKNEDLGDVLKVLNTNFVKSTVPLSRKIARRVSKLSGYDINVCDVVNEFMDDEEAYTTADGDRISRDTYDNDFFRSDNDGEIYHNDDRRTVCRRGCPNGSRTIDVSQREAEHDWVYSERCDRYIHNDDWDEDDHGDGYSGDDNTDTNSLLDYGADAVELAGHAFDGERFDKSKLYLGIELEVKATSDRMESIKWVVDKLDSRAICKEDGSLGERSFEIVTAPMTYKHQVETWRPFFDNRPNAYVKGWKLPGYGMHVHVNRSALSELMVAKLLNFMHHDYHNYDHQKFLDKMSGRAATSYCNRNQFRFKDNLALSNDKKLRAGTSRYCALNLSTRTDKTIEFRQFQSTMRDVRFFSNLEFVLSLIEFAQAHPISRMSSRFFIPWMDQPRNRKSYPNLARLMVERNYLKPAARPNTRQLVAA